MRRMGRSCGGRMPWLTRVFGFGDWGFGLFRVFRVVSLILSTYLVLLTVV